MKSIYRPVLWSREEIEKVTAIQRAHDLPTFSEAVRFCVRGVDTSGNTHRPPYKSNRPAAESGAGA